MTAAERLTARPDVLIVGSGPIGAVLAARLRAIDPELRILMVEGGDKLGKAAGTHLLDDADPRTRAVYERRARNAQQASYVRDSALEHLVPLAEGKELPAGVLPASVLGERTDEFPGASLAWNVGGMGVHWTAACPWPDGTERVDFIDGRDFDAALDLARSALRVTQSAYGRSEVQRAMVETLGAAFASADPKRSVQTMPMAGCRDRAGIFHRTGPAAVFPPIGGAKDPFFELRTGTLCRSLVVSGDRVTGAELLDVSSGTVSVQAAGTVIVAADALRTPQLLWASGIRPPALGRYLNEHANITGSVVIDPDRFGLAKDDTPPSRGDEPYVGAYWLPTQGPDQPFHAQLMETRREGGEHRLGLTWYIATRICSENRVEFSESDTDLFGMPAMTLHFAWGAEDLADVDRARVEQRRAGRLLGAFDAAAPLLEAGSSLHYTGTVRMGARDDGTSVADPDARVWGFENLFVAGNGVIPTAMTCNTTLTAAAFAVLTANAVAADAGRCEPDGRVVKGAGE